MDDNNSTPPDFPPLKSFDDKVSLLEAMKETTPFEPDSEFLETLRKATGSKSLSSFHVKEYFKKLAQALEISAIKNLTQFVFVVQKTAKSENEVYEVWWRSGKGGKNNRYAGLYKFIKFYRLLYDEQQGEGNPKGDGKIELWKKMKQAGANILEEMKRFNILVQKNTTSTGTSGGSSMEFSHGMAGASVSREKGIAQQANFGGDGMRPSLESRRIPGMGRGGNIQPNSGRTAVPGASILPMRGPTRLGGGGPSFGNMSGTTREDLEAKDKDREEDAKLDALKREDHMKDLEFRRKKKESDQRIAEETFIQKEIERGMEDRAIKLREANLVIEGQHREALGDKQYKLAQDEFARKLQNESKGLDMNSRIKRAEEDFLASKKGKALIREVGMSRLMKEIKTQAAKIKRETDLEDQINSGIKNDPRYQETLEDQLQAAVERGIAKFQAEEKAKQDGDKFIKDVRDRVDEKYREGDEARKEAAINRGVAEREYRDKMDIEKATTQFEQEKNIAERMKNNPESLKNGKDLEDLKFKTAVGREDRDIQKQKEEIQKAEDFRVRLDAAREPKKAEILKLEKSIGDARVKREVDTMNEKAASLKRAYDDQQLIDAARVAADKSIAEHSRDMLKLRLKKMREDNQTKIDDSISVKQIENEYAAATAAQQLEFAEKMNAIEAEKRKIVLESLRAQREFITQEKLKEINAIEDQITQKKQDLVTSAKLAAEEMNSRFNLESTVGMGIRDLQDALRKLESNGGKNDDLIDEFYAYYDRANKRLKQLVGERDKIDIESVGDDEARRQQFEESSKNVKERIDNLEKQLGDRRATNSNQKIVGEIGKDFNKQIASDYRNRMGRVQKVYEDSLAKVNKFENDIKESVADIDNNYSRLLERNNNNGSVEERTRLSQDIKNGLARATREDSRISGWVDDYLKSLQSSIAKLDDENQTIEGILAKSDSSDEGSGDLRAVRDTIKSTKAALNGLIGRLDSMKNSGNSMKKFIGGYQELSAGLNRAILNQKAERTKFDYQKKGGQMQPEENKNNVQDRPNQVIQDVQQPIPRQNQPVQDMNLIENNNNNNNDDDEVPSVPNDYFDKYRKELSKDIENMNGAIGDIGDYYLKISRFLGNFVNSLRSVIGTYGPGAMYDNGFIQYVQVATTEVLRLLRSGDEEFAKGNWDENTKKQHRDIDGFLNNKTNALYDDIKRLLIDEQASAHDVTNYYSVYDEQ